MGDPSAAVVVPARRDAPGHVLRVQAARPLRTRIGRRIAGDVEHRDDGRRERERRAPHAGGSRVRRRRLFACGLPTSGCKVALLMLL